MSEGMEPRKRGRVLGYKHPEVVRKRIRVTYMINRLSKHVAGEIEMSQTQIRAAEILLRKALPDLSSIEHTGEVRHSHVRELTDQELMAIAAGSSARTLEQEGSEDRPLLIHGVYDA